jgi:hypothetical protein
MSYKQLRRGIEYMDFDVLGDELDLVTPTFVYAGADCLAASWPARTYGSTVTNSGTAPGLSKVESPLGTRDRSVLCAVSTTGPYAASGSTIYDQTTDDLMCLLFCKVSANAAQRTVFGKGRYVGGYGDNLGYWAGLNSSHQFEFRYSDTSNNKATPVSAAVSTLAYHVGICMVDPNEGSTNGSQWYVDGVRSGTGLNISAVGSITNSYTFKVGRSTDDAGNMTFDSHIVGAVLWQKPTWWPGGSANLKLWDRLAQELYRRITRGTL